MSLPVRKFREVVFQLLYTLDMGLGDVEESISLVSSELRLDEAHVRRAAARVDHLLSLLEKLDLEIAAVSKEYALDRIQRVERNILRLGIYELLFDKEVPPKVAIAEAIRLTRKFSTPQAALFVNALLDAIYQKSQGEEVDLAKLDQSLRDLGEE